VHLSSGPEGADLVDFSDGEKAVTTDLAGAGKVLVVNLRFRDTLASDHSVSPERCIAVSCGCRVNGTKLRQKAKKQGKAEGKSD
jgi:hypothetical protein